MKSLKDIAVIATLRAQSEILKVYQNPVAVEWKEDLSPVTIADKMAEEVMREIFLKETPDFGIIGEEFSTQRGTSEYNWIIDPIDGTKSFICGVPLFGTLLALYKGNEPVLGIINMPALGQLLVAESGQGITLNGVSVPKAAPKKISESVVLSGTLNTMEKRGYGEQFYRLRHAAWLYRGWGDCYGYFLVATGKAQVMCDPVVSVWDIAPMQVIFAEAGGEFSFFNGNSLKLFDATGQIAHKSDQYTGIATNGLIHSEIRNFF